MMQFKVGLALTTNPFVGGWENLQGNNESGLRRNAVLHCLHHHPKARAPNKATTKSPSTQLMVCQNTTGLRCTKGTAWC